MNRHNLKVSKCGATDSKYFSNPKQFEKDIEEKRIEKSKFESELILLLLKNPNKIKQRYNETIEILLKFKKDNGL